MRCFLAPIFVAAAIWASPARAAEAPAARVDPGTRALIAAGVGVAYVHLHEGGHLLSGLAFGGKNPGIVYLPSFGHAAAAHIEGDLGDLGWDVTLLAGAGAGRVGAELADLARRRLTLAPEVDEAARQLFLAGRLDFPFYVCTNAFVALALGNDSALGGDFNMLVARVGGDDGWRRLAAWGVLLGVAGLDLALDMPRLRDALDGTAVTVGGPAATAGTISLWQAKF